MQRFIEKNVGDENAKTWQEYKKLKKTFSHLTCTKWWSPAVEMMTMTTTTKKKTWFDE